MAEDASNPNSRQTPKQSKIRFDQYLVDAGHFASKSQAHAQILAGNVRIDGQVVDKPGTQYAPSVLAKSDIQLEATMPYVSRGGLKLEKALDEFKIDPSGLTCLDIGASTGGFTDCLLQRGASKVFAVDVGHGQLDWKLRQDERVVSLEKTNVKALTPDIISEPVSLSVMDVSFISVKKAFPAILSIFRSSAERLSMPLQLITLVKPQFEYKDYCKAPGFDGIVRDPAQHETILQGLLDDLTQSFPDFRLAGLSYSPVTGPKGNIEFLLHLLYIPNALPCDKYPLDIEISDVLEVIAEAHRALAK